MRAGPPSAATYLGRVRELRALVDELAPASWADPRWWALLATIAAAERRTASSAYLVSDAGLATDTFMAWTAPRAEDPIAEALVLARAAAAAIGALDGTLIDQPLAGTIVLGDDGPRIGAVALDAVAIAAGARVAVAPLEQGDATLHAALAAFAAGGPIAPPLVELAHARPFCTIALGDDAWATARHGHRRGWTGAGGPWLGLARCGDHVIASTSHLAIDGLGHALLCAAIARAAPAPAPGGVVRHPIPALAPVPGVRPLALATRAVPSPPRAVELAYRLGAILGDDLGVRRGMSPTVQIPVAPGAPDDPDRMHRRVMPALVSVRWTGAQREPLAEFAARARAAIAREAAGGGLASRVNAAGRALPLPLAWKRRVAQSPGGSSPLFAPLFELVAGRGCASVIRLAADRALPLVAASGPSRTDPIGSTVVTIVDAGARGAVITATGTGHYGTDAACEQVIDRLLSSPRRAADE